MKLKNLIYLFFLCKDKTTSTLDQRSSKTSERKTSDSEKPSVEDRNRDTNGESRRST